ncbi:hypothetical protein GDO86_016281 [Hymenochirus boettgeri]|uniref:Cell death regulator Aven n=1 Tax=Hymenochirus boettgeri TaxID=247094 RepID=A0A8T2JWF2_9PIPI|nr:hypothetical protein GDO86_016281 [Hymenochirus boettgeri]
MTSQASDARAGDAFAQFRFADEREWGTENSNYKQALAASLDPQCLARVLQELPLYLRLNVEPELVQEDLPQELPPFNTKRVSEMPTAINNKCTGATGGSTQMQILPMGNTTKTFNESQSLALDEELDFLLNLESPSKETDSQTISQHEEVKLQVKSEDPPVTNDVELSTVEKNKTLSSEDLEDWLDSMIS